MNNIRTSPGIISPALKMMISPTTTSLRGISWRRLAPLSLIRSTVTVVPTKARSSAMVRLDRYSCTKRISTLIVTITRIKKPPWAFPRKNEIRLSTQSSATNGFPKFLKNCQTKGTFPLSVTSLDPCFSKRSRASSSLNPCSVVPKECKTSSTLL